MTNEELIETLRYCFEKRKMVAGVPLHVWCDRAADALEATEKRIAELEKQHGNQLTRNIMLTAQIPKEGEWIWLSSTYDRVPCEMRYWCSVCHHEEITHNDKPWKHYCPNCGARMKGEEK
jgi:rubrerythrin